MCNIKPRTKGFTLIEVLIGIAVVALIAVVSVPIFSQSMSSIHETKFDSIGLFKIQSFIENNDSPAFDIAATTEDITLEVDLTELPFNIVVNEIRDANNNISLFYFEYDKNK